MPALKELGYNGVEVPLKAVLCYGLDAFKSLLAENDLEVIPMVFTDGVVAPGEGVVFGGPYPGYTRPSQPGESDKALLVETHLTVFKEQVLTAVNDLGATKVTVHSLKDYFTPVMAHNFYARALAWTKEMGYPEDLVLHETHR